MKKIFKWTTLVLLTLLITACSKPEKKELAGSWQWKSTTGGIGGWYYTPESEGFEAEMVFKGGTFTFYKDGEKVTSGAYSINYDLDMQLYDNKSKDIAPGYSFFRFRISEAQAKKIAEATDGKINLFTFHPSGLVASLGYSEAEGEVFSLSDGLIDGFGCTFVKN